ncbi:prenyltransferase [Haloarchaeobius sp. DFWS5]|uniref:prenyltransferase n=1 Tax=Haloarchaeobius sp. DFWS5 TaxID=3446114 RepID=UPI003EB9FAAE
MSRPSHLLLILLVYALGVAMAAARGAPVGADTVVVGAMALLPTAASVHYINEYADHETDELTDRTRFSGGSGALARTGLSPRVALAAAVVSLVGAIALTLGSVVVATATLRPAAVVTLASIAVLGWAYSVGPALAWRGLGEVTNAFLGGLLLPLYGVAVVGGPLDARAVLAVLPFASYVFANLLATQWPDRRADAAVGKRTLPTRWSPSRLRVAYLAAAGSTFGLLALLPVAGVAPAIVCWPCFLVVPLAARGARRFTRTESPAETVVTMVALAALQLMGWTLVPTDWTLVASETVLALVG